MSAVAVRLYRFLFLRKRFFRFNQFVFTLALHGMGLLNYESDVLSGEAWFLKQLRKRPFKSVIDVGGNAGKYAEQIVAHHPETRLDSFEAHPVTFRTLKASADRFGYYAHNFAIGAEKGCAHIYDYAENDGSQHASLYKDVIEQTHGQRSFRHEVAVTTLDDFAANNGISYIDLLKIDTEGHELQVLLGAATLLHSGSIEMIQLEFNEMNVVSRVFVKDFFRLLSAYKLFRLLPDGLVPLARYNSLTMELFGYQNLVAIRSNSPLLHFLTNDAV